MADFHEVRFPDTISKGSSGGPSRRTDIVTLRSGFEERNAVWADSRRSYDAGLGLRNIDDLYDVLDFWEARFGALYGFRWKDWMDYKSCKPLQIPTALDQVIGTGTGAQTKFQLKKAYASGVGSYTRAVTKPVAGTVLVAVNGVATTSFTLDSVTGIITLSAAPALSASVTAGFEFDVPARFNQDELIVSVEAFNAGSVPKVDVIEVKTTLGSLV